MTPKFKITVVKLLSRAQPPQQPPQNHSIEILASDRKDVNSFIQSTNKFYNIQDFKNK